MKRGSGQLSFHFRAPENPFAALPRPLAIEVGRRRRAALIRRSLATAIFFGTPRICVTNARDCRHRATASLRSGIAAQFQVIGSTELS